MACYVLLKRTASASPVGVFATRPPSYQESWLIADMKSLDIYKLQCTYIYNPYILHLTAFISNNDHPFSRLHFFFLHSGELSGRIISFNQSFHCFQTINMLFRTVATALLVLFSVPNVVATTVKQKRASNAAPLFAYGVGISGLQVHYGSGLAYLGNPQPIAAETVSGLILTSTSDTTLAVSTTKSTWESSNDPLLYINPNGFSQVGFAFPNSSDPHNCSTAGFAWYGANMGHWNGDSFELKFWAVETNLSGVWDLYWNPDSSRFTEGTAVSLRSV